MSPSSGYRQELISSHQLHLVRPPQALRLVGAVVVRNGPFSARSACALLARIVGRGCGGPIAKASLAFDQDSRARLRSAPTPRSGGGGCMDDLGCDTLRTAAGLAKAATASIISPPIAFRRTFWVGQPHHP